jgi:hypothetical protein
VSEDYILWEGLVPTMTSAGFHRLVEAAQDERDEAILQADAAHHDCNAAEARAEVLEKRIAEAVPLIREYEQTHAKEWPCLQDALRALTADAG